MNKEITKLIDDYTNTILELARKQTLILEELRDRVYALLGEDSDRPEYEGDGEPDLKSGEEIKDEF